MSKPYQSDAVQQFADRFEPLGRDFMIDGGGKIGRYRVSAADRATMIARYAHIGWPKLRTLGAILMGVPLAVACFEFLDRPFRISTLLLWLSPLIVFSIREERRRFREALGSLRPQDHLGPSAPLYRRWLDSQMKQSWGEAFIPGLGLFALAAGTSFKMRRTAFDWVDQGYVLCFAFLWVAPLILKAWHEYRQPAV